MTDEIDELRVKILEAQGEIDRLREQLAAVDRAGQSDARLALALYAENKRLRGLLDADHLTVALRGGIEVWGVEFVQGLEHLLDGLAWFERTGKTVTDNYIVVHMHTKTASYPAEQGETK